MLNFQTVIRSAVLASTFALTGFSNETVSTTNALNLKLSLHGVMESFTKPQKVEFIRAVHRVSGYKRCVAVGHEEHNTPDGCAEHYRGPMTHYTDHFFKNGRMDIEVQHTRWNIVMGTTYHGHSSGESFRIFAGRFGKYIDGMTAQELITQSNAIEARGKALWQGYRAPKIASELPAAEAKLAEMERNLPRIDRNRADNVVAHDVRACEKGIKYARYRVAFLKAERDDTPLPKRPFSGMPSPYACRIR